MEAIPSEFNYFTEPMKSTIYVRDFYRDVNPIATLQQSAPIEFLIRGSPDLYIDLNNSKLEVKCKITMPDGTNVTGSPVGPVNLTMHSLFQSVDMEINGKSVTDPNQLYSYRAFFETLLTYDESVLGTRALDQGWERDTPGKVDDCDTAGPNLGLKNRAVRFADSATETFIGPLHLDLWNQEKDIPANLDIKIRLIPHASKWVLLNKLGNGVTQPDYKMVITNARLLVHINQLTPEMVLAHQKMLQKTNMRLDHTRVVMKQLHIPSGVNSIQFDNVFMGQIPDRITLGLVRDDAVTGSWTLNPYNFEHYDLNFIVITVNGVAVPAIPLEPNFTTGDYKREYTAMLEALGLDIGSKMINLKATEWAKGYTIFVFKLTPGPIGDLVRSTPRSGAARLELKFKNPTPRNISVIVHAESGGSHSIDKYGNTITV